MPEPTVPDCHVVTHVHWDREWYRPFESYRARLVELVEQVCRQLDSGSLEKFHLDGQTITLRDVGALRPDLIDAVREHTRAGRMTIGPWHVLADNQLVSGENLVRNLLAARRLGAVAGALSEIGYSPDAFGHPADLPRILVGFGMDTALVWRGAPAELAEFRWRSPDGSEVYTVNQAYHQAEVLWTREGRDDRLAGFLEREAERRPGGPWLLLDGGDHLAPRDTAAVLDEADSRGSARLRPSSLDTFFTALRAARPQPPVVDGELRRTGGAGTFLLPGTTSARIYLKQENAAAEALLEKAVEPLLAIEMLAAAGADQGDASAVDEAAAIARDALVVDGPTVGHLRHAWELVLENAPHDSICGCSVDEVHLENSVRSARVMQLGGQLVRRSLLRLGLDTRVHAAPARAETRVAVFVPPASAGRALAVTVDVLVAPEHAITAVTAPVSGLDIPFDASDLGREMSFEADLDLLPDSVAVRRVRLRFLAEDLPPGGVGVYRVRLDAAATPKPLERTIGIDEPVQLAGASLSVAADASFSVTDAPGGIRRHGLGRLVDGGDRGDTYNYDRPAADIEVSAVAGSATVTESAVRTIVRWTATLDQPVGLSPDRDGRSAETAPTRVAIEVTQWKGLEGLEWSASFSNASRDHRLRALFPVHGEPVEWTSGQHYSSVARPFGPAMGALPSEPNLEAQVGTHPVHGYARGGTGDEAIALLFDHVTEVQGLAADDAASEAGQAHLAVTLLRSVGWLSRFDLRSRTTGAGPQLPTPGAQGLGPVHASVGLLFGGHVPGAFDLADAADTRRGAAVAFQLRAGSDIRHDILAPPLSVTGAIVSALKPAEDEHGVILRLSNPGPGERVARIGLASGIAIAGARLDETALPVEFRAPENAGHLAWSEVSLPPYGLASFRLTTRRAS